MHIGLSIGLTGQQPLSLLTRALSAIRRNNGTALYVPDDYGLVLGPELSPGLASAAGWTLVQPTSGSVSISAGVLRVNSADGTYCNARFSTTLPTVGKAYLYVLEVTNYTGSAGIGTVGASNLVIPAGTGTKTLSFIADASIGFEVKRAGVCDISISSISVREIISATSFIDSTGTQPVTAINDLVGLLTDRSYGAGNLGGELVTNGGFDSATGWSLSPGTQTATISSGVARIASADGSASFISQPAFTPVANKTYRVTVDIISTSGGGLLIDLGGATSPALNTTGLKSFTLVCSSTVALVAKRNGVSDVTFDNISVREVLGNHATQGTGAFKPVIAQLASGRKVIKFDGSNDLLTLSSGAILQQGTDHFVTAAFVLDAVGVVHTIYGTTSTAAVNPFVAVIRVNADGTIGADWRDDTGVQRVLLASSFVASAGVPCVVTVAKVGANRSLWVNGAIQATSTTTVGTTTANTANLGALVRTTTGEYLNGKLIDLVIDQGTLTEADRRTIERNMANRAGVTYAG